MLKTQCAALAIPAEFASESDRTRIGPAVVAIRGAAMRVVYFQNRAVRRGRESVATSKRFYWIIGSLTGLFASGKIGMHQRPVNHVLGDEPDLHLICADHTADQQVIRAIVAVFSCLTGHRACFLEHDFVCL